LIENWKPFSGWPTHGGVLVLERPSSDSNTKHQIGKPAILGVEQARDHRLQTILERETFPSNLRKKEKEPKRKKQAEGGGLWKLPQPWKSTKEAFGDFFLMISTAA
jgi:hypothetical protein